MSGTGRYIVAVAASGAALACSNLTKVSAPDIIQPIALENPQGALTLRAGAVIDFAIGVSNQALWSGLIADEFIDRTTGQTVADQRIVSATVGEGYPYDIISTSRLAVLNAIGALQRYNPTPPTRIAELFAYLGEDEIMFAENMCSAVPLGTVTNGRTGLGPTLTRSQLLQRALTDLDSAANYLKDGTTYSDSILQFVRLVRGRALLDSGAAAAAASAVDSVPLGYAYAVQLDGLSELNFVYQFLGGDLLASVSDREGVNGLNFVTARDPRVPTLGAGLGGDNDSVYTFTTYASLASPITIASGVEGRLIVAEADLHAGDATAWAAMLNGLRQTAIIPAMDTLTSDSTTGASTDLRTSVMFRERAFWLFATGHRQGDLRRLGRQYGRQANAVFPTGPYKGGPRQYGDAVAFVPFGEQGNPGFSGCDATGS